VGIVALLAFPFASTLRAQESYPPSLTAPAAALDTFLVLVPVRSAQVIAADIAEFRQVQQLAVNEGAQAEALQQRVEEKLRLEKATQDNDDAREDAAKKGKNEPKRAAAAAQGHDSDLRVKLLERRRDLRSAEIDMAAAHAAAADAVVRSLVKEQALEQRRSESASGAAPGAVDAAQDQSAIATLELQVLEAQREAVKQREEVTKKERAVIERRIALHKSGDAL
jgi:hypothetical protein